MLREPVKYCHVLYASSYVLRNAFAIKRNCLNSELKCSEHVRNTSRYVMLRISSFAASAVSRSSYSLLFREVTALQRVN